MTLSPVDGLKASSTLGPRNLHPPGHDFDAYASTIPNT